MQPRETPFSICLLGELEIAYAGKPLPVPPYRTYGLLAVLLLRPQPMRRDRLAGLLFPDIPERQGRRRLSDLLWLLRQSLLDLPLEANAHEVLIPPERRWLDVEAFRQAVRGKTLSDWLQALTLYRGDLLEGVYKDYLMEERERLYLEHIRLLHQACGQLVKEGRFSQALPLAERLVQAEEYDEKALRLLMHVYQALGRRGPALAAYERFVSQAADELEVDPEPATQALAQAIRNDDPWTSAASTLHAPIVIPEDAEPGTLLQYAREVLERGDRGRVKAYIGRLRSLLAEDSEKNPCLLALEIDAALFFEEYDRAAQLLNVIETQTASMLVQVAKLAMARHQKAAALEAASQALVLAGGADDRRSELEALLILAEVQCEMGQAVRGARSAERALSLARESGSPAGVAAALLVGGRIRMSLGNQVQALSLFHKARALAHEHGLRRVMARALYRIGVIQCAQGTLAQALTTTREALSIWRDLGLQRPEIVTAQSLALYHALLGDSAECLRIVERVGRISKALGDPVRIAIHRYHLADTLIYHDEALAPRAVAVAREALDTFQAYDQSEWEASTLATLGCALWLQGQFEEALDACRRAGVLHQKLEEMDFLPGVLALEGLIQIDLGTPAQALACTRQGLQIVMQGSAVSDAVPDVYYAHAMALAACGQKEQARDYFSRAYQHLVDEAAQHQDEPARQALFHRSPITRRLMVELYARGIAPPPDARVVTRQLPTAHGRAPVQVRWTVDAGPADAALKHAQGAIALRRARLARLRQEAERQGAQPTVAQLADALSVSPRTIKRDLAALRQGQPG